MCRWGRLASMFSDVPEWGRGVYRYRWRSLLLSIFWESFRNPWENSRSFELFSVHWQTNRTAFLAHAKKKCAIQGDIMNHTRKWELCAHLVSDTMANYQLLVVVMWPLALLIGWEAGDLIRLCRLPDWTSNCKLHFQRSHSSSSGLWIATLGVGLLLVETETEIVYV